MTGLRREYEAQLRRHMDALYFAALDLSGNSSDAEDVVQETAMKGLRRFDSFQPGTDFKAWMLRILSNTYIDLYRRRRREKPAAAEDTVEAMAESESPLRCGDLEFLLPDDVERALASLPPGCRTVFVLHDVEGCEHQEIATLLGIADGTSKSQLHKARMRLRGLLGSAGGGRGSS